YSKFFHPRYIYKYGQQLHREFHYDLMTSHDFGTLYIGWGAYFLAKKTQIPWISEIHHIPGIPRQATIRDLLDQKWLFYYVRKVCPQVSAFRVVNQKQVPEVLKSLGIPESKIRVLYSAYLDLEIFAPDASISKCYDLVFCGRLVPNKGIFLLLKALKQLLSKYPQIQLAMIGEGPLKKSLQKFAEQQHLSQNIQWLGWVPSTQELARIYNQSKVLVSPSFHEGGPRVTLEALACGTPVICTRVGIMNEILQEGQTGYFTEWTPEDIASKITQVLDSSWSSEKRALCRQSVQHLEKNRIVADYAQGLIRCI
ncbi:MAG: glycosyltransferase, partial [Planctomycetota bacterium]